MSTFNEISLDEGLNFNFWSERALCALCFYREHVKAYGRSHAFAQLERKSFRSNMKGRRLKEYLIKKD